MIVYRFCVAFILIFIQAVSLSEAFKINVNETSQDNKEKLSTVQVLTFKKDVKTTGRRTEPEQQLQCIGGSAGCKSVPNIVNCYNRGSDGLKIKWECAATLASNIILNETDVSCEGYENQTDPYVLVGSCRLKFNLDYKDREKEKMDTIYTAIGIGIFVLVCIVSIIVSIVFKPFREVCCTILDCMGCLCSLKGNSGRR